MEKVISFVFAFLVTVIVFGQQVELGERKGLIQTTGSIYPTLLSNNGSWLNRIGGHAEYYFDDKYSFRGSVFHYFSTQKGVDLIHSETTVCSGFERTFTVKRLDYFFGVGAGMSFVSMIEQQPVVYYQAMFELNGGMKFHVYDYFYFFAEIHSQWFRNPKRNEFLNLVPISGGLGLQLPTRK